MILKLTSDGDRRIFRSRTSQVKIYLQSGFFGGACNIRLIGAVILCYEFLTVESFFAAVHS